MRALLLHTNRFETNIIEQSNKPVEISPETQKTESEKMLDGLTCFFTVESNDNEETIDQLYNEIIKTAEEIGVKRLMLSPFVHLSEDIADPAMAKHHYQSLLKKFSETDYEIHSSHFGYQKSLVLDVKGHPGSFRFRRF